MENIEVFEGLRRRILGKGLIFLNIIQNQGVILYIFPHVYPFAQPKTKTPSVRAVFLFLDSAAEDIFNVMKAVSRIFLILLI